MLGLQEHISLSKNTSTQDDLDFEFLRKSGIAYIESLSSKLWTDYNSHDPGITILEVLCYALTDLGQRISLPIETLIAHKQEDNIDQFHKASDILSCKPVTHLDYRKLFIDVPGVRNAWLIKHKKKLYINTKDAKLSYRSFLKNGSYAHLKPQDEHTTILNGLYDLIVDLDGTRSMNSLRPELMKRYQANRNLCEDLIHITEVGEHPVKICAQLELEPEAEENLVKATVLQTIDHYLTPSIRPKTLAQLLESGLETQEIFNGPILENGFLDSNEVKAAQLRTEVRQSDLVAILTKIDGIKYVKAISIGACSYQTPPPDNSVICIENGKKPVLCDKSSWSFFKGFIPLVPDEAKVKAFQTAFEEQELLVSTQIKSASQELDILKGNFTKLAETSSIQNDLPEVYGVGPYGLKSNASEADKIKAKQLKAYLLFFDQLLANYFKHLSTVCDLLSVAGDKSQNFFAQPLTDIKGLEELLREPQNYNDEQKLSELFYSNYTARNSEKRHEIVDHLLSRFAEDFGNYAFLMQKIYGDLANDAVLDTKERFLKQYAESSYARGAAFNWYQQPEAQLWETDNISALQKRLYLLLGITDINRRNLSEDYIEIYEEKDADNKLEYRWRIKNGSKTILSSATKNYASLEALHQELILVKRYATDPSNYKFRKIKKKNPEDQVKWYFVLVNPTITNTRSEDYIIARRIAQFNSRANARKASRAVLNLVKSFAGNEGIYLIEHILLRPDITKNTAPEHTFLPICKEQIEEACEPLDPYSFRVSIVLPGWTERFGNIDFRRYVEDLICRELPSHILPKICWIGYPKNYTEPDGNPPKENEMVLLEAAYKIWLLSKTNAGQKQDETALTSLNKVLSSLHTIYHQGRLYSCTPSPSNTYEQKTNQKVILGRTHLGKL